MKMRMRVAWTALALLAALGCEEPTIVGVTPESLSQFAHDWIEIEIEDLDPALADPIAVEVDGRSCLNVHFDGSVIRCQPQGAPVAGPVDVEVIYGLLKSRVSAPGALSYVPTAYPSLSRIYNIGPSLSAGITNMGWEPEGNIHAVPALVSRQIGTYFPQRVVLERGIPPIGAPTHVDLMFVGDGVRPCYVPALNETRIPEVGELCTPLIWDLDDIPVGPLVVSVLGDILRGLLEGEGIVGGLFQDADLPVQNWAIPGAQMVDYAYGTRIGFNLFQWMIFWPTEPLFNPFCLGEPVVKMLADTDLDVVVAFDWFFDSVLFSHPPLHDLLHQLLFSMLCLSTSNYYNMQPCAPGESYGGWGVPLIRTDGSGDRTFQPFAQMPEDCQPGMGCRDGSSVDLDAVMEILDRDPIRWYEDLGQPKANTAVDYFRPGYALASLIDPAADTNGNGYLDIDFQNPANNEVTAELIASILMADDPADNPKAVILSTMPWPAMSPSGQGGEPGGGDDQYAEVVNEGVLGLYALFQEAFVLAGLPNNIVMMDTFALTRDLMMGNRPDLTHMLDGDPSTMDIWYEYDPGPPLKRNFLQHGGAFSLDHLHMSETMNAAIASQIIEHINARLGTDIPTLDIVAAWNEDPYRYSNYDPSIQCAYLGVNCP